MTVYALEKISRSTNYQNINICTTKSTPIGGLEMVLETWDG